MGGSGGCKYTQYESGSTRTHTRTHTRANGEREKKWKKEIRRRERRGHILVKMNCFVSPLWCGESLRFFFVQVKKNFYNAYIIWVSLEGNLENLLEGGGGRLYC